MPAHVSPASPVEQHLLAQFGRRLKEARLRLRAPSSEIARRVGISRTTLGKAEAGDASVTLGTYAQIMSELGLVADVALLAAGPDERAPADTSSHGSAHGPQDLQSLLLHVEAVKQISEKPALVDHALTTLQRWSERGDSRTQPLWDAWREILEQGNWLRAVEVSERGNQLRQASPLATLLPDARRLDIIRAVKRMKGRANEVR